jgi:heme exporter protein C
MGHPKVIGWATRPPRTHEMKKLYLVTILCTLAILGGTTYLSLAVAPTEQTMGDVYRIFYYHVPSAWVAGLCFFINFVASFVYLLKRSEKADALAAASAEVGIVFGIVLLISGPLWAKPVWGIWWTWDARLTSTLVQWVIYIGYLILRRFSTGQSQVIPAVFAMFCFVDEPMVYFSIRWFRTQHPSPVLGGGPESGLDPSILHPLLINVAAFTVLGLLFVGLRYKLQLQERALDLAHAEDSLRGPSTQ